MSERNDRIEKGDEVALAVQTAVVVKQAAYLIGCRSWTVRRKKR